jgi:hypothetical protein
MPDAIATSSTRPGWATRHPRLVGALLLFALHAVFLPLGGFYLGAKPEAGVYMIGLAQLYYVVPCLILMMKLGRKELAKGMLLAAAATFIVNAAGCGMFLWGLSKIDG